MIHGLLNKVHHALARSRFASKVCLRLRNQANCVVGYHIGGHTHQSDQNGENSLIERVGPYCNSFVDVGANIGDWSVYFIGVSPATGVLFEPGKACFDILKQKIVSERLELRCFAVGDVVGEAEFVEDLEMNEHSSVASTYVGSNNQKRYSVPLTTLDKEFLDCGKCIDFLKIDTEGYDFNVLKGAEGLLNAGLIKFVQFEYNFNWIGAGATLLRTSRFLKSMGYETFLLRETGLCSVDFSIWGEFYAYANFVAIRKDCLDVVMDITDVGL